MTTHRSKPHAQDTRRPRMFDREASWIQFNARVLAEAVDEGNPLLERLLFLKIFHTNLDEFFMIRVSGIKQQVAAGLEVLSLDGLSPKQRLARIRQEVRQHLETASACLTHFLRHELPSMGITMCRHAELDPRSQQRWNREFEAKVLPILTPLAVSPAFPFPFISNLSLNIAVFVTSPSGERRLVRIKIPDHLPRYVPIDERSEANRPPQRLMRIEDLIASNLQTLFPGMTLDTPYVFRVTRDADVDIREDEADDLLKYIEEELRKRRFGAAVRLEIDAAAPLELVQAIQDGLALHEDDIYRISTQIDPTGIARLMSLELPEHKFPPFAPRLYPELEGDAIFDRIRAGDVLLHHPFDSFVPIAEFVRQAARDPKVLAIKQTLYRTSGNSPVVEALLEAVGSGKQVAAVVELKARFDEENNISWARRLEEAGVHVIYGVPGLKTHAKLCLVVRQEPGLLRRYAHIGTGNYNPITAKIYTDLGLLTCDREITADVANLFNRITGFAKPEAYHKSLVAPRFMKPSLLELIRTETEQARAGKPASIIFKCNAITESDVVEALYEASRAGVDIQLIVRGICAVVPGIEGMSDNIHVRSTVGRFLEHSRVYWFYHGGSARAFIGSADLMGRNLLRRIEVLIPIEDPQHRRWLRERYLQAYLDDTERSHVLQPDGAYLRLRDEDRASNKTLDVQQFWLSQIMDR